METTLLRIPRIKLSVTRIDWLNNCILFILSLTFFSPALWKGLSFGIFNYASIFPLLPGNVPIQDNIASTDLNYQMGPWYKYNWMLIHQGKFPLWDKYEVLGMPHFFNFQSATLSLPSLISYLFPIQFSYLVIVIFTMFIAGSGAYVFARTLKLSPLAALFAAITFQLSGSIANWIGWPLADVNAWLGWLLAFSVLLLMSTKHRRVYMTLLSLSIAFTLYGGHPESYFLVGLTAAIFIICVLLYGIHQQWWDWRYILTFASWEIAAVIFGVALASPLLLPGIQLVSLSGRNAGTGEFGLPLKEIFNLTNQGYFGYPLLSTNGSFDPVNYYESAAYVGPLVIVLGLFGFLNNFKKPGVMALATIAIVYMFLIYKLVIFQSILHLFPALNIIFFSRDLMPLDFCMAILAGFGVNTLLNQLKQGSFDRRLLLLEAALFIVLIIALVIGETDHTITHAQKLIRLQSFKWPMALLVPLLLIWAATRKLDLKKSPYIIYLVLIPQTVFLLTAGMNIPSYSPTFFPASNDMQQVQAIVGDGLLGMAPGITGSIPDTSVAFNLRLFQAYDPMLPQAIYTSWAQTTEPAAKFSNSFFDAQVSYVATAQEYGINYLMIPGAPQAQPLPGTTLVRSTPQYQLFYIPNSAQFTLAGNSDPQATISAVWINNYTCRLHIHTTQAATLISRITNVPGWQATVNGRPVTISSWNTVMQQLHVAAGESTVELTYWPSLFSVGITLAIISGLILLLWNLVAIGISVYKNALANPRAKHDDDFTAKEQVEHDTHEVLI